MKKIFLTIFVLCFSIYAQSTKEKYDAVHKLTLALYVPQQIDEMTDIARNNLENKLSQIVTTKWYEW